jgi:hypothetical protein
MWTLEEKCWSSNDVVCKESAEDSHISTQIHSGTQYRTLSFSAEAVSRIALKRDCTLLDAPCLQRYTRKWTASVEADGSQMVANRDAETTSGQVD